MGGGISVAFSSKYPALVQRLVLIAPAGAPFALPFGSGLVKLPFIGIKVFEVFSPSLSLSLSSLSGLFSLLFALFSLSSLARSLTHSLSRTRSQLLTLTLSTRTLTLTHSRSLSLAHAHAFSLIHTP